MCTITFFLQHDPETDKCSPGGELGNYIMFARATSGDKPNNNKFSECSQASMALVMEAKARHAAGCFIGEELYFYRPQTKFAKAIFSQVSVNKRAVRIPLECILVATCVSPI